MKFGKPKELWKSHFSSGILPDKEETEIFLNNVCSLIETRGNRIAKAIKKALKEKDLEEYAKNLTNSN